MGNTTVVFLLLCDRFDDLADFCTRTRPTCFIQLFLAELPKQQDLSAAGRRTIMKNILLMEAGGTIASDVTEDGLAPELSHRAAFEPSPRSPASAMWCRVQLLNLDSTNMRPEHWLKMVRCIRESYDRYDGFVITHGTDTMAYTAAALSYLIWAVQENLHIQNCHHKNSI